MLPAQHAMSEDPMDIDLQPEVEEIEPRGPKPIHRLTKDVINQIAAAEIIHRPSNAIKELLENSLDAGSTSIKISVKDGGLKLLQITDNGHGINKDDLPLLCERYATSKLQKFEDLQSLGTYGFRGEALASISYCSHVEVVTKTKNEGCGWKAHYQDGSLVPAKPGGTADPKPAAANDGTVITAADLFYNMPLRKRAFKSTSDEYNRIIDVVTKYAIHNPHVAWVCKKAGTALPDVATQVGSNTKANIAALYTSALANELLEIPETELQPPRLGAKLKGWVSNANSSWSKKGGWLLFINNRLVNSNKLKKAVEGHYTSYLPKGASPWAYLSLQIDPAKIDVNVHPTKSEVRFLNEDEIVDAVVQAVQTVLEGANLSRSFTVQTLLPGAPTPLEKRESSSSAIASASFSTRKAAPNYKVRMDPSNRTLDSMFTVVDPSQISGFVEDGELQEQERPSKRRNVDPEFQGDESIILDDDDDDEGQAEEGERERVFADEGENAKGKAKEIEESLCHFTSIQSLRRAVKRDGSAELHEIFQRHAFVGVVDRYQCLSLIQHSTKLFLVNHGSLGDEHFYQLGLRQFGAFNRIRLDPAPQLKELLTLAAEDEPGLLEAGLEVESVVDYIASLLRDRQEMLDEYFSLLITENGKVETLPMLLKGYTPNLDRLPHFLLCLGTQVDWDNEKECFQTFLRELAFFYSPRPFEDQPPSPRTKVENMNEDELEGVEPTPEEIQHQLWQLEHVLFPSFRRYTVWPKSCLAHVNQLADLPDLFRIFERC
ncbi:DNA mismatch repair protein MLH1 [Cryptococcus neoformans Bt1]|nr:DNA mismatch repair protein MLH1 [Cryptococcus neoformans var. grubii Bt1]